MKIEIISNNQNRCLMKRLKFTLIFLMTFLGFATVGNSQECLLNCDDLVNISLDSRCVRIVSPFDILTGDTTNCTNAVVVEIQYPYNDQFVRLGPDQVDKTLIGYTLIAKVTDTLTGNSCWGRIKIEDKYPPELMCGNDTISCFIAENFPALLVDPVDNCEYPARTEILQQEWIDYNCDSAMFLGRIERTIRAIDVWGNASTCDQILYISRESLDSLVAPQDTAIECCDPKLDDEKYVDFDEYGRPIPKPVIDALGNSIGLVDPPYIISNGDTTYIWPTTGYCQIYAHYKDHIIEACGHTYKIRREWKVIDWCDQSDTVVTQWIKILDTLAPVVKPLPDVTVYAKEHDCKAHFELKRPTITKECWDSFDDVEVRYSVEIPGKHGVKGIFYGGTIAPGKTEIIYLPAGWHTITYILTDGCLNTSVVNQLVYAVDRTPPTPVCDEITQVTLDPEGCWARVYAENLDDGSRDNCCEYLHFAVARMEEIDQWREHWRKYFEGCFDHYEYHERQAEIDSLIEHWINCYVFDDYVDLTDCGSEQVVLRVYEACGLPLYDDHVFKGSKHDWYCFNLYDDFACFFKSHYDSLAHYADVRPDLTCASLDDPNGDLVLYDSIFCTTAPTNNNYLYGDHDVEQNPLCCDFETVTTHPLYARWNNIKTKYPELVILCQNRYSFRSLYSDCMVEVRKDDKVPPICEVAYDKTVYCDGVPYNGSMILGDEKIIWNGATYAHDICEESDIFSKSCAFDKSGKQLADVNTPYKFCVANPWDGLNHGYYGGPVYDEYSHYGDQPCEQTEWEPIYCRVWLLLDQYDSDDNDKPDPESYFDEPTITDNCELKSVEPEVERHINECGVGYVKKTWTATDECDNVTVCHQKVIVKSRSDFEVIFPADVDADCNETIDITATEEGAGYPVISDDDCELVGINKDDQIFHVVEEACYKILRTWTIIDWCVYNPDQHYRRSDIIVDDRLIAGDARYCVYRNLKDDGDGIIQYVQVIKVHDNTPPEITPANDFIVCVDNEDCIAPNLNFELGTAKDGCTAEENIAYRWYVVLEGVTDENDYIYGEGNKLTGIFPLGLHAAYLIAGDKCGNEDTVRVDFAVNDCKKPTPYCYHGIATVIMPTTGGVRVWAKDLDAGSFDNCTLKENLVFSFEADPTVTHMDFTCADLGTVEVNIWVTDEAGNQDFCTTYLSIQANEGICDSVSGASINGKIMTEDDESVEFVEVKLKNNDTPVKSFHTGVDGKFAFNSVNTSQEYTLSPYRNDDHANGVSTLDLVYIQKHILGIQKLNSPYKVIAADINRSETLSAIDLVELRKLILGVYDEFPNNTSWRFVDKNYQFSDEENPWGFPEYKEVTNMNNGVNLAEFMAIKVGDVNNNRAAHSLMGTELRNNSAKLTFRIDDMTIPAGTETLIDVTAKNFNSVEGYQFTMLMKGLTFIGVEAGKLDITTDNFGIINTESGLVTTSWNAAKAVSAGPEDVLFSIKVRSLDDIQLSDAIAFNSLVTRSEAYTAGSEVMNVNVEFTNGSQVVEANKFDLYQNTPNPFTEETTIGFVLPADGDATIKILDVTGKVLKVYQNEYAKGYNQLSVAKKDLPSAGVMYYQLETKDFSATKKMVLIH